MSIQSDQIDDALSDIQQALIDAADAGPYTSGLQAKLDDVTLLLQTIENNLVLNTQQAILDALADSNAQLKQLNADIDAYTDRLDQFAALIKKVSNTIAITVSVISAVVSAGVI